MARNLEKYLEECCIQDEMITKICQSKVYILLIAASESNNEKKRSSCRFFSIGRSPNGTKKNYLALAS